MVNDHSLNRFIEAQETDYSIALSEIMHGKKRSHWMWYIFPQVQGLGLSETTKYFAIKDIDEAEAFLNHPVLGSRFIRICNELLKLKTNDAHEILGSPDDRKLHSSMTLFSLVKNADPVFKKVLNKYFDGEKDLKTLQILNIL